MSETSLYNRVYGWVDSVLNPASVPKDSRVSISISDDDFAAMEKDVPYIVIGYTPATLTPIGNGGTRLDPSEKNTNGVFNSGETHGNLYNFHDVEEGALIISVDDEDLVNITGLDFTECLNMTQVALVFQNEINAILGNKRIKVRFIRSDNITDPNYFEFRSVAKGNASSVVIEKYTVDGIDLTSYNYLNGGESIPGITDGSMEQIYLTDYEGEVEIRQVYGEGELLRKLVESKWLPSVIQYFSRNNFSLNDLGPIQGIPFSEGSKTIKESMITCTFSFFGIAREDMGYIEKIGVDGLLTEENSGRTHEINIGG